MLPASQTAGTVVQSENTPVNGSLQPTQSTGTVVQTESVAINTTSGSQIIKKITPLTQPYLLRKAFEGVRFFFMITVEMIVNGVFFFLDDSEGGEIDFDFFFVMEGRG